MHTEQREIAIDLLKKKHIERALFACPDSLTWLSGYAPQFQMGPSPYSGGPALAWYEDREFSLIVMDGDAGAAEQSGLPVMTYPGYTYETPFQGASHLLDLVQKTALESSRGNRRLSVESAHLPAFLYQGLADRFDLQAIDGIFTTQRQVKTDEELEKLRVSFAVTDAGQAASREATWTGQREIDVWTAAQSAIERQVGERVVIGNDCVVSYRNDNSGGWPEAQVIRSGDSLIVDLGVRLHGYWSDSCATYYASTPSQTQIALHHTVQEALAYAISLIKPGVRSCDIDQKVRSFLEKSGYPAYPHHTGHGVGVSAHEEPRITPYNKTILQPGMVVMLEPGIYIPGEYAVRLEDAVLVTGDGADILTHHDKNLP